MNILVSNNFVTRFVLYRKKAFQEFTKEKNQ